MSFRSRMGCLLLLGGCATPNDPCVPMCAAAAERYGSCLESWGTGWEAAGYQDEADFLDACDTWAWTSRELARDAGRDGAVEAECRERRTTLESGTCEDFVRLDWSGAP